jgi:hypothetical protein
MTYRELVFEEALKLGIVGLNDESADFILWERTAFPLLGEEELRREVSLELSNGGWKGGGRVKTKGPTAWDKIAAEEGEEP